MTKEEIRQQEILARRKRFRASVQNDPELLKDLIIGLQWAAPAAWEAMTKG